MESFLPEGFLPEGHLPEGHLPGLDEADDERITIEVNSGYIPIKDPDDDLLLEFDWSDVLSATVTLVSVTHVVSLPLVASNQVTDTLEGTSQVDLSGAVVHGALYVMTVTATLSDGSTVVRSWPIRAFNS